MRSRILWVVAVLCIGTLAQNPPRDEKLPNEVAIMVHEVQQRAEVVKTARDDVARAEAWYQLQLASEDLARALEKAYPRSRGNEERDLARAIATAERVQESGVSVFFCDAMQRWAAGVEGYDRYLELLPKGPRVEESTWRGTLDHRDVSCSGYEGFDEENAELAGLYRNFLARFPDGVHAADARKKLAELEELVRN